MTKKHIIIALFFSYMLLLIGCAGTINVEKYPFGSPIHHVNNGIRFLDMGFTDDAFREFASAIKDDKHFSPGYAGKGIYWSMVGVPDVAQGYIHLSLKFADDVKEEIFALKSSMRVEINNKGENWLKTVYNNFSNIDKKGGVDAQVYYWMGTALINSGDSTGAHKYFKKATELTGRYKRLSEQQLKKIQKEVP